VAREARLDERLARVNCADVQNRDKTTVAVNVFSEREDTFVQKQHARRRSCLLAECFAAFRCIDSVNPKSYRSSVSVRDSLDRVTIRDRRYADREFLSD